MRRGSRSRKLKWLAADPLGLCAITPQFHTRHTGAALIALDGVVGVAESYKIKAGKPTRTWAIIVLVEEKRPKSEVGKSDLVPAEIDNVPTDVVEVGKIEALVFNAKTRPALPGFSIGHHAITAGTFGCVVRDIRRSDPQPG